MCGLLTPDSGSGTCLGYDLRSESAAIKRNVGYMTQRFSFWDDLTIRENLDFTAQVYAMPDRRAAVDRALEDLGLTSRADQLTGTLSGGWKQRLALACCMLHRPRLLLLDEPTAGVDPNARREFWEELHRLAAQGISVLVSTHYMDEAERCHKLAYIAYGRLLAQGTAREVDRGAGADDVLRPRPGSQRAVCSGCAAMPGVEQTVAFGETLHVTGRDAAALERALRDATAAGGYDIAPVDTGLEDVFIHLMQGATDNWGSKARLQMTERGRRVDVVVLVPALVGDGRQGVPAAAPRPRDVRDDRRHPDHPADALRLRDQHRSEAHADRADRLRPQRVHAHVRRGDALVRLLPDRRRAAGRGSGPRARSRSGTAQFVVTIPPDFTRRLLRGERPSMLLEADASDPTATGAALAAIVAARGRRRARATSIGPLARARRRAAAVRRRRAPPLQPGVDHAVQHRARA